MYNERIGHEGYNFRYKQGKGKAEYGDKGYNGYSGYSGRGGYGKNAVIEMG